MRVQLLLAAGIAFGHTLLPNSAAVADTLNVPGDYTTIQEAIDAAMNEDEICVAPGTYNETIDFLGKPIAVYSSDGPLVTTIDGTGLVGDAVVKCVSGEDLDTILEGFTITGADIERGGPHHGMLNEGSNPTVRYCIFHHNLGGDGAGMLNVNSNPWIEYCTFSDNSVTVGIARHGGGMYNGNNSSPTVIACTFIGNIVSGGSNANRGGGMFNVGGSNPLVTDCTFAGNIAGGPGISEGGGIWNSPNSLPIVGDSFFCENTPDHISGPYNDSGGNVFADECEVIVNLDIKPGSCPNSFNRNSHGVLPVALVGTDSFDVMEVDLATVLLTRADGVGGSVAPNEGPPGPHSEFEDVATPFDGELCDCHELGGDGLTDLSMKFRTDDVVSALLLNDLPAGDLVELVVSGALLDGTPFSASDCIRLVPPGTPPGILAVGSNAPGAFIDVTPLDLQLDGGGFGSFERTFPLTTAVTLTAPAAFHGWVFAGWLTHGGLHPGQSIDIIIHGEQQSAKAIYAPAGPTAAWIVP